MESWVAEGVAILIVGIVIGGLARILLPGVQRIGVFLTIIAGTIAALAGHFIADPFDWGQGDGSFPNWPQAGDPGDPGDARHRSHRRRGGPSRILTGPA